jgi:hypothetical protein
VKRPSFQFYPGDWSANPNLKRCTFAEKGIWLEVMCLMHDQPLYGVLQWPLKEIAEAVKCKTADLQALIRKGVLKGDDKAITEPFIYVPRSGRRDGDPVTLIGTQPGPFWYSSRMVKDEYIRTIRGESTRFSEGNGGPPKHSPKPPLGDGPSSSSSSSPSGKEISNLSVAPPLSGVEPPTLELVETSKPAKPRPPDCPHGEVLALWAEVLPQLPQHLPSMWRGARADHLRARWRETAVDKGWADAEQGLAYFRKLFAYIGASPFLTGRSKQSDPSRPPFVAELEWIVNPANWAKVHEGKYHAEAA